MKNFKLVKTTAALALGASVVTAAVVPGTTSASAASKYKVTNGKLVNAKTGKVVKGYVVFKSKLYYNGKLKKGYKTVGSGKTIKLYYNGSLKKGYKTARNSKLLFFNGSLKKGYKSAGSGERLYKDGFLAKGYEVYGDVDKNPKLYYNGYLKSGYKTANNATLLFYNGELKKGYKTAKEGTVLYKDGRLNEGLVELSGVLYDGSKQNEGKKLFEGTLYDGAKRAIGLVKFEDKYYNDGVLANGEFVIDGEKVKIENGVLVGADKEAPVLKVDGETSITVENGAELKLPVVTATDNNDKEVEVKSVITDAEGKELKEIDTKVAGTYTVTYSAEDAAGNKAENVVVTVVVKEGALKVETVSAINPTTAKVTFNNAIEKLTKDDVTVTNKNGNKQYIKSVELAADGKSATVSFYDAFTDKTTYNVSVKSGETTVTGSFDFVMGEVKSIVLEDQKVAPGKDVAYKVIDANGLDITSTVTVGVETDNGSFFKAATKGSLTVADNATGSAFVKLTATDSKGNKIESSRAKVTVNVSAPTTLGDYWTLGNSKKVLTKDAYKATDYKQNTTVNLDSATKYVNVSLIDQFGEDTNVPNNYSLSYNSLDTDVAVVDVNTGAITPRKEGTAAVRVTLLDNNDKEVLTKTVTITVAEKAKVTGISVENTALTLNADAKASTYTIKGVDQFNNEIALPNLNDTSKAAVSSDETIVKASYANGTGSATGTGVLTLTPQGKAGTATVTVKYGDYSKVITVTVNKLGEIADYSLEGFKSELTTRDDAATKEDETKMTFSVYGKDASGTLAVQPSNITYVVTDKDGKEVKKVTTPGTEFIIDATEANIYTAGQTYTLTVKVGTLTVANKSFTVKENGIVPTFSLKGNKVTLDGSKTIAQAIESQLEFATESNVEVTKVEYTSNNSSVLKADGTIGEDGTATIYVDKVTVKVIDSNPLKNGVFTLDLKGETINVTVNKAATESAAALKEAQEAVTGLFNADKTDLAEGVNQEAITAASNKVNALADTVKEKAGLKDDVKKAQGLLDAAKAAEALQTAIDNANTALGNVAASTSAYTSAGGLTEDEEYTDVTTAESALQTLVTAGTDKDAIVAATKTLTDALAALDEATTALG